MENSMWIVSLLLISLQVVVIATQQDLSHRFLEGDSATLRSYRRVVMVRQKILNGRYGWVAIVHLPGGIKIQLPADSEAEGIGLEQEMARSWVGNVQQLQEAA